MLKYLCLAFLLAAVPSVAQGATATFNLTISSPNSVSVALTPIAPCTGSGLNIACTEPLTAGQNLANIVVTPVGWTGTVAMSGTTALVVTGTAPNFVVSVGSTAITVPQTITFTLTATP